MVLCFCDIVTSNLITFLGHFLLLKMLLSALSSVFQVSEFMSYRFSFLSLAVTSYL